MPRNASTPSPGPRKSPYWPSHIRQLSRASPDRQSLQLPHSPDTVSSQSTIRDLHSSRRSRLGRRCTVTINDAFTRDEVLLGPDLLVADFKSGLLMAIDVLKPDSDKPPANSLGKQPPQDRSRDASTGSVPRSVDTRRRYVFVAKGMTRDQKSRYPAAEVLVAKHIADAFGMKKGSQVHLTAVDPDNPATEASHVELSFKDQYLSRSDMWRLAAMELSERTVYKGQMLLFLGTVKAQVTSVFVKGRKVHSAFFGRKTRPIFRSESARYVLFIQMSREMWDFDSDGSGEILFNKVVDGFLPALFKKWISLKVRHLVSVVLFSRIEYDTGLSTELANTALNDDYYTGIQSSGPKRPYKDFYRVVVSEMGSGEWTTILYQLKREFNFFRRDISNHHQRAMSPTLFVSDDPSNRETASNRIKAEPSYAVHGNVLEAINTAATLFANDYVDRDLMRTGVSAVIITPSPGVFEVEYDALQRTTDALAANGIGIDLVCIPRIPLHSVPLFRYQNPLHYEHSQHKSRLLLGHAGTSKPSSPQVGSYSSISGSSPVATALRGDVHAVRTAADEWLYALPHWLHVSYWVGTSNEPLSYQGIALSVPDTPRGQYDEDFGIRCRMYDLQMRSVLHTNEIETSPLLTDPDFPNTALHRGYSAETTDTGIKNTKVPHTLFEHVYGFHRFAPDRKSRPGTRSLWKQLQEYDETKSRLPTSRRGNQRPTFSRDGTDQGTRQHAPAADPGVLGTSLTKKASISPRESPSIGSSLGRAVSERSGHAAAPRRGSLHLNPSTGSSKTKQPKFMRQISIGQRGFGIAPPKAAVAELSTETASAARSGSPGTGATPIKTTRRPSSRQTTSSGTPTPSSEPFGQHTYRQEPRSLAETPARPIVIGRTPNPADTTQSKSGSRLASALRAEPTVDDRDVRNSYSIREDDEQRVLNSKLLAGALPELPSTLSPTAALSPWLTVLNPSNPDANRVDMATLYSRWQHVFPRPEDMKIMKWKTLCCPAAVPLTTEYFPTKAQFDSEYQRQPYNVSRNIDDELSEEPKPRDELLRELVGLRFSQGFQVVVGPAVARAFGQKQLKIADLFSQGRTAENGTSIFMSAGNTIHQLSCVNDTEVEVNIFVRKPAETPDQLGRPARLYKPAIRTLLDHDYETSEFDALKPRPARNWNYIDTYAAGHNDELTEDLQFWRARFVLIPVAGRNPSLPGTHSSDNEEEIHIEGIRKLAQLWLKHRFVPPEERRFQSLGSRRKKSHNPLDIVYMTEDPSVVIAAELESLPLLENAEGVPRKGQLLTSRQRFQKKNLNMSALAEAMQQPVENGGVRMQNRRWHLRLHYNCFIGSDMTSWLLDNFEDLENREEAETLGKVLMGSDGDGNKDKDKEKEKDASKEAKKDGGLFVHVERRHPFRDGQYFYQIGPEYAKQHPGRVNARKKEPSIPTTPLSDNVPRGSPRASLGQPPPSIQGESSPLSASAAATPVGPASSSEKPRVVLSRMMKYDVDHRRRSYRPEVIDLHFDRLHNPDNCYHIRLDWMNVTAKLVEDTVEGWAREAAQYGLRLVEIPIAEACTITDINSFRRPYRIKLALPPPNQQPATYFEPGSFTPRAQPVKHFYQRAILKKFDFVLDAEAASNFPSNVDVSFSWGKPDFKYTQFIHRSGTLLAEITDEGDFLMLANRLYGNRAATVRGKEVQKEIRSSNEHGVLERGGLTSRIAQSSAYAPYGIAEPTPIASPLARPALFASPIMRASSIPGAAAAPPPPGNELGTGAQPRPQRLSPLPETLKDELEGFCSDAPVLEAFYREVLRQPAQLQAQTYIQPGGTTPSVVAASSAGQGNHIPETSIPTLGLPPGVLATASETSGSPRVGSPAFSLSASQLLRRGSVQDGIRGLRPSGSADGQDSRTGG